MDKITQDIFKHKYETAQGNIKFGGNFYIGSDTNDLNNRLNGTTSIINLLFPFAPIVSPIAIPWLNKRARRDMPENDGFEDIFNLENPLLKAASQINEIKPTLDEMSLDIINVGNYAEVVTLHLLQNNGSFLNLEETIERESDDITVFIKSDLAIELGELCYKEIMKLGKEVKLIDYQVAASDRELWDVGFFDFVIEADGKLILIDMKTGSKVKDSKLEKVKLQLLGSYRKKFFSIYNKEPDRILVIAGVEDEIKIPGTNIKKWRRFGETIDITNDDRDGNYLKIYEMSAKIYKLMYTFGIWSRRKEENIVYF